MGCLLLMVAGRPRAVKHTLSPIDSTFLLRRMFPVRATVDGVLGDLRGRSGGPNAPVRLLALLVVLGMIVAAAPLVVVPLARVLWGAVFGW